MSPPGGKSINVSELVENKAKIETESADDGKAMRTIALLLFTFTICWLPLSIVFVLIALDPDSLGVFWVIFGYWMGYVNSMLNPICYAIGNPFFKETLLRIICGSDRKKH